ncbi:hypothetical protein HK405_008463 [Cladochytrium tenue]|nr:hypothetical protein HK405_008463 [Cladochytrium tenue]
MAGQSNDAETLSTEMQTLVDQNSNLTRELVELRKERLSFHESKRLVENLEHLVAALHAEMHAVEQDATRLRRLNEELERKLEAEVVDSADARRLWQEKELHILTQLRSERDKAKSLRELGELKEDEEMAADAEATARRMKLSHRRSRLESGSGSPTPEEVAIKEQNAILARQVLELTERMRRRDNIAESQEQHILELQRTVAALMDDIESGHAQAEFDQLDDEAPPLHSLTPEPSAQPSEQPSPSKKDLSRNRSEAVEVSAAPTNDGKEAEPAKAFSLADELAKMNEASASDSSLRNRMAALGLSTEGNREALKRRLHKYIARKRRIVIAREEADRQ